MEIQYGNNKIRKQLSNASEIKRAFGVNAKRVAMRLEDIMASPNLEVLKQIPAANCHQLSGDRKREWAVNISANHRLIFEIANNPIPVKGDGSINAAMVTAISISGTEDYH